MEALQVDEAVSMMSLLRFMDLKVLRLEIMMSI